MTRLGELQAFYPNTSAFTVLRQTVYLLMLSYQMTR